MFLTASDGQVLTRGVRVRSEDDNREGWVRAVAPGHALVVWDDSLDRRQDEFVPAKTLTVTTIVFRRKKRKR